MTRRLSALLFACLLAVPGCSAFKEGKEVKDAKAEAPVEQMYNAAARQMDQGNFFEAAKAFDEVDRQYPYSQWATRAQLMSAYAQYKNMKYQPALEAVERFLELHPSDPNAAYAWYLKALCHYEQISDVRRDQKATELAMDSLQQVVQRFPGTSYARDAALKIDLTRDHLAGKEMEIGRYYLYRKQYQAGINRFQKVVEQYQTTTHVPEALHRMVESYLALGIRPEAQKAAAILGRNFPDSRWYKDSYRLMGGQVSDTAPAKKKSLFGRIFD